MSVTRLKEKFRAKQEFAPPAPIPIAGNEPVQSHNSAGALLCRLALVLLALTMTGCGIWRSSSSSSRVRVGSLVISTNMNEKSDALEVLQRQAERFADSYAATVAQAVDDYNLRPISPEARLEAVRWKVGQATAAYVDASGAEPVLNVLDLVVLATMSRMVMEDEITRIYGPDGLPMLVTHRQLETNVWNAVERVLKPEQQQQLRDLITQWREKNPDQRYVATTRLRELAVAVGLTQARVSSSPNSLLGLLYLDPFAGLDPTAAAIQETRQMAERAMYYTQRMPTLLNWQVQLISLNLTAQPEVKQVMGNAERITRSTETFAAVAKQLPDLVSDQREAAIRQILDGLAAERTNWLASLTAEQQKTSTLLVETRQALNAASEAATSVDGAVKSLDGFVRYVSPPNTNQSTTATNSRPFNVLDYGTTASQVGAAAKDLNAALLTLNQSTPGISNLSQNAAADADRVVTRAFRLGVVLVLILLAGAVLSGLCYRILVNRIDNRSVAELSKSSEQPKPNKKV